MTKMRRKSFERYQRRQERAAISAALCSVGLAVMTWMSFLDALAAAAW